MAFLLQSGANAPFSHTGLSKCEVDANARCRSWRFSREQKRQFMPNAVQNGNGGNEEDDCLLWN